MDTQVKVREEELWGRWFGVLMSFTHFPPPISDGFLETVVAMVSLYCYYGVVSPSDNNQDCRGR